MSTWRRAPPTRNPAAASTNPPTPSNLEARSGWKPYLRAIPTASRHSHDRGLLKPAGRPYPAPSRGATYAPIPALRFLRPARAEARAVQTAAAKKTGVAAPPTLSGLVDRFQGQGPQRPKQAQSRVKKLKRWSRSPPPRTPRGRATVFTFPAPDHCRRLSSRWNGPPWGYKTASPVLSASSRAHRPDDRIASSGAQRRGETTPASKLLAAKLKASRGCNRGSFPSCGWAIFPQHQSRVATWRNNRSRTST